VDGCLEVWAAPFTEERVEGVFSELRLEKILIREGRIYQGRVPGVLCKRRGILYFAGELSVIIGQRC
jgi:hypothetical protein